MHTEAISTSMCIQLRDTSREHRAGLRSARRMYFSRIHIIFLVHLDFWGMKYVYKSFYCDSNKNLYVLSIRRRDTMIMSSVHSAPKYYIQICPFSLLYFILFYFLNRNTHSLLGSFVYTNPKLHCTHSHRAGISMHFYNWSNSRIKYTSSTPCPKEGRRTLSRI